MWKESYRIGVERIDEQHRRLFEMVDGLVKAIESEAGRERYAEAIQFMKDYVVFHFADEEDYQESIGYMELEEHRQAHRRMTRSVLDYERRFQQTDYDLRDVKNFAGTLTAWLIYHVADADQRFAHRPEPQEARGRTTPEDALATGAADVLEKMAGLPSAELRRSPAAGAEGDIFVEVGLTGDHPGRAVYAFSRKLALGLIETMTFVRPEGIDELVCSALAEIGNIASGNAATRLACQGLRCDITPPVVSVRAPVQGTPAVRIDTPLGEMRTAFTAD